MLLVIYCSVLCMGAAVWCILNISGYEHFVDTVRCPGDGLWLD